MATDDKPTPEATDAFVEELWSLLNRFRSEWHLSYAAAIGCLYMAAQDIANEASDEAQKEERDY